MKTPAFAEPHGLPNDPVLPAYRDGSTLRVWCEHERTWHVHGLPAGPRASHCRCESSPLRGGYDLEEAGPFTTAIREQHGRERRGSHCPTCGPRQKH
ncbi:hypothetical protein [Actinocorallia aurantiaca]|uniref:Uncharacterized protein n=1 Tax=Actinocorallia aurantiaca TaxID=46204 RepID=A0ABN3U9L7_9ACTN